MTVTHAVPPSTRVHVVSSFAHPPSLPTVEVQIWQPTAAASSEPNLLHRDVVAHVASLLASSGQATAPPNDVHSGVLT